MCVCVYAACKTSASPQIRKQECDIRRKQQHLNAKDSVAETMTEHQ